LAPRGFARGTQLLAPGSWLLSPGLRPKVNVALHARDFVFFNRWFSGFSFQFSVFSFRFSASIRVSGMSAICMISGVVNEQAHRRRSGGLATHGVCAPCKFVMADLMERQGVMRAVHRARGKKLSRHGARARFDKLNTNTRRGTLVLISCALYASFSSLSSSSASTGHAASTPAPAAWRSSGAIAPCHVAARASGSVAHSPASVDRFAD
jgi:hypothetical protein